MVVGAMDDLGIHLKVGEWAESKAGFPSLTEAELPG